MLCSACLRPLEYTFLRKRKKRYTGEDGSATETISVVVGHCLQDGHYSTIFSDEIIKNKQYCIADIRSVLENKADCSLASSRTRAYWKSWFHEVWDAVIQNIQRHIGRIVFRFACLPIPPYTNSPVSFLSVLINSLVHHAPNETRQFTSHRHFRLVSVHPPKHQMIIYMMHPSIGTIGIGNYLCLATRLTSFQPF